MSNFFKKAIKIVHPLTRAFEDRGNPQGYTDIGERQAHQADLDSAMKDYETLPQTIRDQYTSAAKRAGTYSDTPEFASGLGSEITAGVRGARVASVARINALRKAMGDNEEFKPEGFDQTQANKTADTLALNPEKEETPTSAVSADAPSATSTNATTSLQSAAPTAAAQKRASVQRFNFNQGATSGSSRLHSLRRYLRPA